MGIRVNKIEETKICFIALPYDELPLGSSSFVFTIKCLERPIQMLKFAFKDGLATFLLKNIWKK